MKDHPDQPAIDDRLASLLERYQRLRQQGQPVSPAELCPDEPVLAAELQRLISTEEHIARLANTDESIPETVFPTGGFATLTPLTPGAPTEAVPVTDRYEVLETLGKGGMGAVYRARDRVLKRHVALKVIRSDVLTAEMRQRFLVEAEAVAQLDHPNIVKVFDVGEWTPSDCTTTPYLALEFVPGGSLSRHLGEGPMDSCVAAQVVRLLARAVAHAHARGVIHRDLKPDNVLIAAPADEPSLNCALGCPKVSDFGLARRESQGQRLTQTGAVMGTPTYMAPEQAEGLEAGPPADVFALGVILYRLLAGRVPFDGKSAVEVLYCVIRDEPTPPGKVRAGVPADLESICLECLRKKPDERPTAAELAARLEPFARETADLATTITMLPVRRPSRRGLLVAGAMAALAVAALAWWLWPSAWRTPESQKDRDEIAEKPKDGRAGKSPQKESLKIQPLKVTRYERAANEGINRGVIGKDVSGARFGDAVTITVELSEPAYFYIIGFNFNGKEQLLWPADAKGNELPHKAPPKLSRLRHPASDEDKLFLEEDDAGSGIQAYVVVASRSPLPGYSEWRKGRERVTWRRLPAVEKVWQADTKATYPVTPAGVDRAQVKKLPSEPPLAALCRSLVGEGEVAEAVAFGVRAKEGK